jgi:hypothetical protein
MLLAATTGFMNTFTVLSTVLCFISFFNWGGGI